MVNGLQLLTAKPVVYLVNLSEKDYIRKKNKFLPKIKQWIDTNNPGDPLIPFSVSFEERLAKLTSEDKKIEEEKVGANSALPKITHAGYSCLEVGRILSHLSKWIDHDIAHPLLHMWSRRSTRVDHPERH